MTLIITKHNISKCILSNYAIFWKFWKQMCIQTFHFIQNRLRAEIKSGRSRQIPGKWRGLDLFRQIRCRKIVWQPDFSCKMVRKISFCENTCSGTLSFDENSGWAQITVNYTRNHTSMSLLDTFIELFDTRLCHGGEVFATVCPRPSAHLYAD